MNVLKIPDAMENYSRKFGCCFTGNRARVWLLPDQHSIID